MNIKDYKVGQNVYIRLTGNAGRGKTGEDLIEEWEVLSVGRKLIKAKRKGWRDYSAISFEQKESGYNGQFVEKTNTCVNYIMYESREAIENDLERESLLRKVSNYFNSYGEKKISLESLRIIAELIN